MRRDGGCGGGGGGCVHFLLWTRKKGGKWSKKSGVTESIGRQRKRKRSLLVSFRDPLSFRVKTFWSYSLLPAAGGVDSESGVSGWIKTQRLSLQMRLIELLDWSRQSLSFCSLTLAFQNESMWAVITSMWKKRASNRNVKKEFIKGWKPHFWLCHSGFVLKQKTEI